MVRLRWDRLAGAKDGLRGLLSVSGFGFLSAAAWTVALPLGLAAVGVSCLLLDFMADRSTR